MDALGTPEHLRRTRAALAEIPIRLDGLRVSTTPLQPLNNDFNTREGSPSLPSSYLSPAPSPDELVIQLRGRKRLPASWSPDIDLRNNSRSSPRTPTKSGVAVRSSPRKRLILDNERIPFTPEKLDFSDITTPKKFRLNSPIKTSIPVKRLRLEKDTEYKGPLDTALKGLSPTQLMEMIKTIVQKHPEIEQELRQEFPKPDMKYFEEKLSYLKSNIFKSLPSSRLTSKTDSPAYSRVSTHLSAFKKCVIDQGKALMESQHWESVIQYVFLAWSYVRATPVWDNQPHNVLRKQCFKALTNFMMTALKKTNLDKDDLIDTQDKLQSFLIDTDDIQSCIKCVHMQLKEIS